MSEKAQLRKRAEALLGRVLRDKWQLDALVGVGGMGAVFAATHRNNGARAAIKVLHPELAVDEDLRARFLREGYVANKVDHPGVCAVLDDDVAEDGLVYLVLELLEGETLRSRWVRADKKLMPGEVLTIAERVLDVLAAAHEKRIVHRDMKPENVFLCGGGDVKVLDFGIARLREMSSDRQPTRDGAQMGTPAFMAPEQARSLWDAIDGRADIFSLGATLFTLLTGEYVHPRETPAELLVSAATEAPRSLRTVMRDVDPRLADVVDRALVFDPAGRWQSAREMREAIVALRAPVALDGRSAGSASRSVDVEPPTIGRRSDLGEGSERRPRLAETRPLSMPPPGIPSSPRPSSPRPASTPPARTLELPPATMRDAGIPPPVKDAPPPEQPRFASSPPLAKSLPPPSSRRAGMALGVVLALAAAVGVGWFGVVYFGGNVAVRSLKVGGSAMSRPTPAAREVAAPPREPTPAATASAKTPARATARPEPSPPPQPRHHRGLAP